MCVVCELNGVDYLFLNGSKDKLTSGRLYKVYDNKIAQFPLCHIHSIELFCLGERNFLRAHLELMKDLNDNRQKYAVSS